MIKDMTINILGTPYDIHCRSEADDPKLKDANGYCEPYSKELVVGEVADDPLVVNDVEELVKKVLRHEIVHAFLHESGLSNNSEWAVNEEVVDWIALQAPKLAQAFKDAGAW